ncbi:hypothetical protein D3C81_1626190 [compost metagenome]
MDDGLHHFQIRAFIMTAYIIHFTTYTFVQYEINRSTVIIDMQPVPNIFAIAVNRNLLFVQNFRNRQWNQLLREMVRAVIVRAPGNVHRQAVGFIISSNEQI